MASGYRTPCDRYNAESSARVIGHSARSGAQRGAHRRQSAQIRFDEELC
jgi:hypothetical protein